MVEMLALIDLENPEWTAWWYTFQRNE